MKFLNLISFALLAGQTMAQTTLSGPGNALHCDAVDDCITITQACASEGFVRLCVTSDTFAENSRCDADYSHINAYSDGLNLDESQYSASSTSFDGTCASPGNKGCGSFTGNGVKWGSNVDPRSSSFCVTVPADTDVTFAFKKKNTCDGTLGGICTSGTDCSCSGSGGACVIYATAESDLDCSTDPEISNDPHLKSWRGEWFDYMGECDLKLLHAPMFDGKTDLDIHVRTTIKYTYSYIEAAALQIGGDILEVGGWGDFAVNGVDGAMLTNGKVPKMGGYPTYYTMVNKKKHIFDVVIGEDKNITISTYKDWVSVKVHHGDEESFGAVSGLMGTYDGKMLARDGSNLHDDINALGQDWQIRPEDGDYFRSVRAPQYPDLCKLPPAPGSKEAGAISRRLGQQAVDEEAAKMACSHLEGDAFTFCFHDVMASQDLEMAQAGAY